MQFINNLDEFDPYQKYAVQTAKGITFGIKIKMFIPKKITF